jgi:hypothetical protein
LKKKLTRELGKLIRHLLFNGQFELSQIQAVFSTTAAASNLQPNLKNLLSKLLADQLAQFRTNLIENESKIQLFFYSCELVVFQKIL